MGIKVLTVICFVLNIICCGYYRTDCLNLRENSKNGLLNTLTNDYFVWFRGKSKMYSNSLQAYKSLFDKLFFTLKRQF